MSYKIKNKECNFQVQQLRVIFTGIMDQAHAVKEVINFLHQISPESCKRHLAGNPCIDSQMIQGVAPE